MRAAAVGGAQLFNTSPSSLTWTRNHLRFSRYLQSFSTPAKATQVRLRTRCSESLLEEMAKQVQCMHKQDETDEDVCSALEHDRTTAVSQCPSVPVSHSTNRAPVSVDLTRTPRRPGFSLGHITKSGWSCYLASHKWRLFRWTVLRQDLA